MATMHEKLKELRKKNGLTLAQIADKLGISEATAQRYETGKGIKSVPYETIEKYAIIFNCTPQYIIGWQDTPPKQETDFTYSKEHPRLGYIVQEQDFIYMPENKRQEPVIISVRDQKIQRATELLQQYSDDDLRLALEMLERISPKEK